MDREYKSKVKTNNLTPTVVLIIYLIFLVWRMFFFAYKGFHRLQSSTFEFNLIPFKTIINFITGFQTYNLYVLIYNLFGNIVIFIPLGFLLPFVLKRKNNIKTVICISFLIILLAEIMQLISRVGVFDIDDFILNLLGCFIGYLGYRLIKGTMCK